MCRTATEHKMGIHAFHIHSGNSMLIISADTCNPNFNLSTKTCIQRTDLTYYARLFSSFSRLKSRWWRNGSLQVRQRRRGTLSWQRMSRPRRGSLSWRRTFFCATSVWYTMIVAIFLGPKWISNKLGSRFMPLIFFTDTCTWDFLLVRVMSLVFSAWITAERLHHVYMYAPLNPRFLL